MEQPVIESNLGPELLGEPRIGLLSLSPERRIVLNSFEAGRFCAEAPTEVGLDLNNAYKISIIADAVKNGSAEAAIAQATASNNMVLNKRSQGLQLYLAASYTICQIYLNKAISGEAYSAAQLKVLEQVIPLIQAELPYLHSQSTRPTPQNSISAATEALNKTDTLLPKSTEKGPKPVPPTSDAEAKH
jgi:hypothetical protein